MASRTAAALLALAALAAAAPPSARWASAGAWDAEALFQGSKSSLQVMRGQQELAADGWPSLSDIWQHVVNSTNSITDAIGAVLGNASDELDSIVNHTHQVVGNVAKNLAGALERVLKHIENEVDVLKNETMKGKQIFLDNLNQTVQTAEGQVVPDIATALNISVNNSAALWQSIDDVVKLAASTVATAFKAAGQEKLGDKVQSDVEDALGNVEAFMEAIQEANKAFQEGAKDIEHVNVDPWLQTVDDYLNDGLKRINKFIVQFENTIQDIIDALAEALSWSSEDVDAAFAPVSHEVTAISWRVRSAGRELVTSLHTGLVEVAKSRHAKPPVWGGKVQKGAAAAPGCPLAATALALFAAAAL